MLPPKHTLRCLTQSSLSLQNKVVDVDNLKVKLQVSVMHLDADKHQKQFSRCG